MWSYAALAVLQAPQEAWQYGVLGVVALVFGYAVVHQWRVSRADAKAMEAERLDRAAERAAWQIERHGLLNNHAIELAELREEYEVRHREVLAGYTKELREDREASREHEDQVRRDFAELMEKISADSSKAADALVQMLQKFYDRFVGPRGRY